MKAKLIRMDGTIEAEGTPEELTRLFKEARKPDPIAPFISGFTVTPSACLHDYPEPWISITPPACKKCGHIACVWPMFAGQTVTVGQIATTSGGQFPNVTTTSLCVPNAAAFNGKVS